MTEKENNDDGSVPLPMKELEEIVRSLIEHIMDEMADEGFEKPAFYGFSVFYNGADNSEEQHFSTIKLGDNKFFYVSKKDAVVECTEIDDKLYVTVDAGVDVDDVSYSATDFELEVQFETEEQVFTQHVELETKVDPESSKMNCKNGVVEIVFQILDE